MSQQHLFLERSAVFSPCRTWRYQLWRRWRPGGTYALWVCLNPSDADEFSDDNTAVRVIDYSTRWGHNAACVVNLNAFCTTYPKVMKAAPDPVGPDNDSFIVEAATGASLHVAAWGTHGGFNGRDLAVTALLKQYPLSCLTLTAGGHPHHPLRLKADLRPIPFEPHRRN